MREYKLGQAWAQRIAFSQWPHLWPAARTCQPLVIVHTHTLGMKNETALHFFIHHLFIIYCKCWWCVSLCWVVSLRIGRCELHETNDAGHWRLLHFCEATTVGYGHVHLSWHYQVCRGYFTPVVIYLLITINWSIFKSFRVICYTFLLKSQR